MLKENTFLSVVKEIQYSRYNHRILISLTSTSFHADSQVFTTQLCLFCMQGKANRAFLTSSVPNLSLDNFIINKILQSF